MRSMRDEHKKLVGAALVLLMVAAAGAALPFTDAFATISPDLDRPPAPDDDGGGTTCTYCSDDNCECDTPPPNCILYSSCGCSSADCWRSCDPYCT